MDFHSPFLNSSTYLYQHKSMGMDDMRQSLVLTMELQESRVRAERELKSRDDQILHLKNLLSAAIKERDQALHHCNQIIFDKMLLHHLKLPHHSAPNSAVSSIEDDPTRGIDIDAFSSSDCDESIASSPQRMPPAEFPVAIKGPLPEKGQFLRAVVQAGPLLQTLLLAGPLPQWRHPPPPVDPCQIPPPPVVVPLPPARFLRQDCDINIVNDWAGRIGGKRGLPDVDWSIESKHQRVGSFMEFN